MWSQLLYLRALATFNPIATRWTYNFNGEVQSLSAESFIQFTEQITRDQFIIVIIIGIILMHNNFFLR